MLFVPCRSAAKKRVEKALSAHLSGDAIRTLHCDTSADALQLVRHLADLTAETPIWRQQRPNILVESADFERGVNQSDEGGAPSTSGTPGDCTKDTGVLKLTGYIRGALLTANQIITAPGAGDFQILRVEGPSEPTLQSWHPGKHKQGGDMDMVSGEADYPILAVPSVEEQEPLVRENIPDALDAEQTWPTEEELRDAEQLSNTQVCWLCTGAYGVF